MFSTIRPRQDISAIPAHAMSIRGVSVGNIHVGQEACRRESYGFIRSFTPEIEMRQHELDLIPVITSDL